MQKLLILDTVFNDGNTSVNMKSEVINWRTDYETQKYLLMIIVRG